MHLRQHNIHKPITVEMQWKDLLKQISCCYDQGAVLLGLCTGPLLLLWLKLKGQPWHFKIIVCLLFFTKVLFYSVIKITESQRFFTGHHMGSAAVICPLRVQKGLVALVCRFLDGDIKCFFINPKRFSKDFAEGCRIFKVKHWKLMTISLA